MAEQYLIYLRKSRKDRELEQQTGAHDTLERHRSALLQLARDRGLSVAKIYEEVVTGDTIAERPEMQKLLSDVETGQYAGVLVMEVPRLARGNTRDQGVVAETFTYSGTKIITPDKVYNTLDEADEEYFEFGLFLSRREYKAINKRLSRGRMASLHEGKYIAGTAPYGYEKVKLPRQKGYTLRIVEPQASVVRQIYTRYVHDGIGSFIIANDLNDAEIPSPAGQRWSAPTVRDILSNPVYTGFLRWQYRPVTKKVQNGVVTTSTPVSDHPEIVEGLHPPIIERALWEQAQTLRKGKAHPPVPKSYAISNPMAGLLRCAVCGRSMVKIRAGTQRPVYRIHCPTPRCPTISHNLDETEQALLDAIALWLAEHQIRPDQQPAAAYDETAAAADAVRRCEQQLARLTEQQNRLYDLLEQGVYTNDVFLARSNLLAQKRSELEENQRAAAEQLTAAQHAKRLRQNVIPTMQHVLDCYHLQTTAAEKNALLKSALSHAVYEKSPVPAGNTPALKLFVFPLTDDL